MFMRKRSIQLLLIACFVVCSATAAFASSSKSTIAEGADLTHVKRIVVRQPLYSQGNSKVTSDEIQAMVSEQGQRMKVDTVTEKIIEREIAAETKIDLTAMRETDKERAEEVFKRELPKHADAYMVVTVVHNSRVVLFFDIYAADTQKRLYSDEVVASKKMEDTMETYELMSKRFLHDFLSDVEAQQKDAKKGK